MLSHEEEDKKSLSVSVFLAAQVHATKVLPQLKYHVDDTRPDTQPIRSKLTPGQQVLVPFYYPSVLST